VVSVNRNIVRYNKYLIVVTVVVVLSVIVIDIVISLEHSSSTVVVGVFKFKFEYPIYSIFRVLDLFHYKYCGEYLLCCRLQRERTVVETLNFLALWLRLRQACIHSAVLSVLYLIEQLSTAVFSAMHFVNLGYVSPVVYRHRASCFTG